MPTARPLFWLHIRKSAGTTVRELLGPQYVTVDRERKPFTFVQAAPEQYNDIVNNHRVVLGDYQFRRAQFAKDFLYPDWEDRFSFAFSREPISRAVSMFWYLVWGRVTGSDGLRRALRLSVKTHRPLWRTSEAFDAFLDLVEQTQASDSLFKPMGIHFATHVAPVWDDITDRDGAVLLSAVFRVEHLIEGLNRVFEETGVDRRLTTQPPRRNVVTRSAFAPSAAQRRRLEQLYPHDFEVYEKAE